MGLNTIGSEFHVREQSDADWPAVWAIVEPVFRAGDSYPLPRDVSEAAGREYWIKRDGFNAVAIDQSGTIIGVYYLRPDQGGPGSHICNAGYVIASAARGRGFASRLCVESQARARAMGFRGLKFNLVVSVNAPALRAWTAAGMEIIATVPDAFAHPTQGFVDAYIMYKDLSES